MPLKRLATAVSQESLKEKRSRPFGQLENNSSQFHNDDIVEKGINSHNCNPVRISADENMEPFEFVDEDIIRNEEQQLADYERYALELQRMVIPPAPEAIMNSDGTGSRLLITHIVNENFKSYYGRHTLGPFHKNFTAIVGPNGSGKSNVIDSLLFVFGYRAQRTRAKNVSVLIHNSERHPNVDFCIVEVNFMKVVDKTDTEFEEVPNSSITIARKAYRNNASEYFLNKRKVQYKDIGAVLRRNGIDIDHNRFLILQGEVEQISLMKPKAQTEGEEGMLEYMEDIVGSSRLKPFIDQIHKRMEELIEMRNEKVNRLKHADEDKAELEGPKNEAVKFLKLENNITRKKNLLFQRYIYDASEKVSKAQREFDASKADFEQKEIELKTLKESVKEKQDRYQQLQQKHDDLKKEAEKCTKDFVEMEKEDARLREDLRNCKKVKQPALEIARDEQKTKLEEFKKQPAECEKKRIELEEQQKELEDKIPELKAKLEEGMTKLRKETAASVAKKAALEEQLNARQKVVADAREKLDLAKSELDICLSAQTREQTKLNDLKNTLAKLSSDLDECNKKVEDGEKKIPEIQDAVNKTRRHLQEATVEMNDLNKEIREKSTRVGTAVASLQTTGNRSRVLDALFNQQRMGQLKGIFGRLGDLGAIDEKYDVAISTACGPLDNIVVDTIDTAQACVEFLNRNNIGMATFIGLDKMKKFEQTMKQPFAAPEGVPRLFDLIDVEDDRVKAAFYYALRDTIVAKDLEQATRIAYQGGQNRYRVVTLGGDVIDLSGTMTGGGTRQSRGRMGRSVVKTPGTDDVTPDQLNHMEEELKTQRARLGQLQARKVQLEADGDKFEKELAAKKIEFQRSTMDIKALKEQLQVKQKQITAQEKVVANTIPDEKEKVKFEVKVENFQKEYEQIAEASNCIEEQVKKIDEQIKTIKEKFVGSVEKELKACKSQIDDTEKAIGKAKVAAKTALRNIKNSEEKLVQIEEDIASNDEKIAKIQGRLRQMDEEGKTKLERRDQALKEQKEFEEDLNQAKKEAKLLTDREQILEQALLDQKARLEQTEQTLKEFQRKSAHWTKELEKLELHDIRKMCGLPPKDPNAKEKPNPAMNGENSLSDEDDRDEDDQERDASSTDESEPNPEEEEEEGELKKYPDEFLASVDMAAIAMEMTVLESNLGKMRPNLDALNEYRKKEEKYQKCLKAVEDVTKARDAFRDRYDELRKQRLHEFMAGFRIVSSKLKEMYQMITLGGDADLELVDTMDPFTEGIAFSVRPPKKSWKQISNLSGGEKTLSSLALVFALHHYKPTPLYVMDEIDAALDFKNVSIVANYIKERTKNAQFIIISLRNNMFELADRLVGIYKTNHCTKTAVINPGMISLRPAALPARRQAPGTVLQENTAKDNEDISKM